MAPTPGGSVAALSFLRPGAHLRARQLAVLCAGCSLALGAVGLVDALSGQRLFGGELLPQYIPMAVSTALLFLLFGWALALAVVGRSGEARPVVLIVLGVATLAGASVGVKALLGLGSLALEGPYLRLLALFSATPTPMSPVTSALFTLAGSGLWLLHFRAGQGAATWRNDVAGYLGVAICFVSLTLLGGYLHGAPFFYGTQVVPVAATTSAAFLLLGAGLVCAAGPGSMFLRAFFGDSVKARLMRIFPPCVALMFLFHPVVEIIVSKVFKVNADLLFSLQVTVLAALTTAVTALTVRLVGVSIDQETQLRQQAESTAIKESRINKVQAEIAQALIRPGVTLQALADILHRATTELTGSRFAFVSTINPVTGDNDVHTLTSMFAHGECDMDRDITFPRSGNGSYPGLWGHALNTLEPFYENAPASHPASSGLPAGHVPLERFLSVPVCYEGQLVGQIGLANPGRDYAREDLDTLQPLADLFALGVYRIRAEQEILAAKEGLEVTVLQRTQALGETNERLRREVADREMFQEALKESAALFKAVVEDQTELICRFRPDGTILFVNNAYARYFGKRPAELTGQNFYSFLTDQARDEVRALLAGITPDEPVQTIEHTVLMPTGEVGWHAWTNRGIFDAEGRLHAFQAVGRDITQAKESERALRELNERLEEKVRERTIQLEERTESILSINKNLQLQIETRRQAEEALEKSACDLQAKVRQISCLYELADILGDGALGREEMLRQAVEKVPSGWRRPEAVAAELVFDGESHRSPGYRKTELCLGHALRVFGVERGQLTVCGLVEPGGGAAFPEDELALFSGMVHQIERALESRLSQDVLTRSEQKFREFFDNAADAIFVHDVDGRILDANSSAGSWLSTTTENLRAENLLLLARQEDREAMAASFKSAAQGQPVLLQATLLRPDGQDIPVEFNCLALDYQGSPALFSSGRNIAKRLRDEGEILHRMETEALVAGISELLVNSSGEQFAVAFEHALGELGRFLRCEQVLVLGYSGQDGEVTDVAAVDEVAAVNNAGRFRKAHGWRAEGHEPLGAGIRSFARGLTPLLLEPLRAQEKLVLPEVDGLPAEAPGKALLLQAGVRSLIAVPMTIRGRLRGALLLAATSEGPHAGFSELGLLDNIALLLANAQEKQSVDRSLRESERLARSIIESLAANICVVDRAGVLTMVNKAWERFAQENAPAGAAGLGVGANYVEVCRKAAAAGEPLAAEAAEGLAAVLAGKRSSFSLEYSCHAPSEQRWFIMQAVPFAGGGSGAVISHRNITARVLAAESVRRSEERYRIIVETAQEGVLGVDAEAFVTYANPKMLTMLGYELGELLGRKLPEIIAPEDLELLRKKQKLRRQGVADQYELRYLGKTGARIWTVTSVTPVMGPGGEYLGSIGMSMDISDRVRAEQRIRKSEARYRSLVEAIQEGLLMLKADGAISYMNAPFARMLGRPASEMLGRPVENFVASESKAALAALLSPSGAEAGAREILWEHSSGRHIYSLFSLSTSKDEDGAATGYFAIATDTTDRKALESQLLHSQKLEAIGQLAAGIAHEINTPAQYVGSNVKFIKSAFDDILAVCGKTRQFMLAAMTTPPTKEGVEALAAHMAEHDIDYLEAEVPGAIAQTLEGVERISTIVRSVKQFAHPGAAVMAPADLNEAMRSTVTVSRNEWKYVADLDTELDEGLPLVVCMIGEINQVVLNLIVNAAHAIADALAKAEADAEKADADNADPAKRGAERKGRITLSTKYAAPWAEIRVRDTGLGIPPAVQAKIFDPFFTTKPVGQGTGQGLTISRSIVVDKHKGQLFFETTPGEGTTFVVRLPLEQNEGRA